MLTCRQATRLVSEARERSLGWRERAWLALHLGICSLCRRYARQIDMVAELLHRHGAQLLAAPRDQLGAEARARIRRRLP